MCHHYDDFDIKIAPLQIANGYIAQRGGGDVIVAHIIGKGRKPRPIICGTTPTLHMITAERK